MKSKIVEIIKIQAPEIVDLPGGEFFATVEILKTDGGYSTEWWISSRFDMQLRVVGSISVPIWGETVDDVRKKITHLRDSVFEFIINTYDGNASIHLAPAKRLKFEIAHRHMTYHAAASVFSNTKERFYALFPLAEQFQAKEVGQLLADVLSVNVRTMHDWIYQYRQSR